ncbi:MAG: IS3 family transposase, partial [Clostridiaceae bacterium]|nr:IS3 family transposase [Clostridiaceae bacterium]
GRKWNGISTQEFIDTLDFYLNWFVNDRIKIGLGGLSPLQYRKSIGANI